MLSKYQFSITSAARDDCLSGQQALLIRAGSTALTVLFRCHSPPWSSAVLLTPGCGAMATLTHSHRLVLQHLGFLWHQASPLTSIPKASTQISFWGKRVMDDFSPALQRLCTALLRADNLTLLGKWRCNNSSHHKLLVQPPSIYSKATFQIII